MKLRGLLRDLIILLLFISLIVVVVVSARRLLSEEIAVVSTEVEGIASIPSLTICPNYGMFEIEENQGKTMEDLYDNIEKWRQSYFGVVKIKFSHEFSGSNAYDLNNADKVKELEKLTNVQFNDVWKFAPRLKHYKPYFLLPCTIVNIPEFKIREFDSVTIMTTLLDKSTNVFYVDRHKPFQSRHNYIFDWNNQVDLHPYKNATKVQKDMVITDRIRLPTKNYECNPSNDNRITDCIDNFIVQRMNCTFPWVRKSFWLTGVELCSGADKLNEFIKLIKALVAPEMQKALKEAGCLVPNCRTRKWSITHSEEYAGLADKDATTLNYLLPSRSMVTVVEDVEIYTIFNFIADGGGYLGLLLGQSLLSGIDTLLSWSNKFHRLM